jgi:hypothetical protein
MSSIPGTIANPHRFPTPPHGMQIHANDENATRQRPQALDLARGPRVFWPHWAPVLGRARKPACGCAEGRFRRSAEVRDSTDGLPLTVRERPFVLRHLMARFAHSRRPPSSRGSAGSGGTGTIRDPLGSGAANGRRRADVCLRSGE